MVKYVKALGSAPARLLRRARLAALSSSASQELRRPAHWAPSHCASGARLGCLSHSLEPAASTVGARCTAAFDHALRRRHCSEIFKLQPTRTEGVTH